jgi:hypothetical protein
VHSVDFLRELTCRGRPLNLTLFYVLALAALQLRLNSRSFVVAQLGHQQNGLGRQNCGGNSDTFVRANSGRTFPYLHHHTSNHFAVAHIQASARIRRASDHLVNKLGRRYGGPSLAFADAGIDVDGESK